MKKSELKEIIKECILEEAKEEDDAQFDYGYLADVFSNICSYGIDKFGNRELKSEYDARFKVKSIDSVGGSGAGSKSALNVKVSTPRGDKVIKIEIKAPRK